jgi:Nucleotide-diphospho-sugar transferase
MMYMTPTATNMKLLQEWENEILNGKQTYISDQDAFISIINRKQYISILKQFDSYAITLRNDTTSTNVTTNDWNVVQHPLQYMTVLYQNDEEFPHGQNYDWYNNFTQIEWDQNNAIIVHNNWIKGKEAKKERFQLSGLWNPSREH